MMIQMTFYGTNGEWAGANPHLLRNLARVSTILTQKCEIILDLQPQTQVNKS